MTVEASPLGEIPHKSLALLDRKLEDSRTADHEIIDITEYTASLGTKQRTTFMLRLKHGMSYPFQLWSWMKGGSAGGISAHYL